MNRCYMTHVTNNWYKLLYCCIFRISIFKSIQKDRDSLVETLYLLASKRVITYSSLWIDNVQLLAKFLKPNNLKH